MQHFIATYGYLAIFLLMVAESACIPIPSELIMTFGGALAAGAVPGTHLNLAGVIIAGAAGNVVGSYIAWAVGKYGGQAALRRWGRRFRIREHDLDRANRWFDRYGPRAVLIGRLLPVVRTFISLPAGIAGMGSDRPGLRGMAVRPVPAGRRRITERPAAARSRQAAGRSQQAARCPDASLSVPGPAEHPGAPVRTQFGRPDHRAPER